MKRYLLILLSFTIVAGVGYCQAPIKRKKKEKTEQSQSSDAKRKQEAEAQRQREAEAKRKQEAEARRKQEEESRRHKEQSTKISEPDGYVNGHGYVDLGLPSGTKWATCNVGANKPGDYGDYFAWGEISTKSSYTGSIEMGGNSRTYGIETHQLRSDGIINSKGALTKKFDTAQANWGSGWRMPTKIELEELKNKCSWERTNIGGIAAYKVTGPNGQAIYFPAAGYRVKSRLDGAGDKGYYWSATFCDDDINAFCIKFPDGIFNAVEDISNQFSEYELRIDE